MGATRERDLLAGLDRFRQMGPLLPVKAGTKDQPLVAWGTEASSDPSQIKQWLRRFPGCNWAMATGHDVVVVDIDSPAAMTEFEARFGDTTTFRTSTPRGWHLYFEVPEGVTLRNSAGLVGENIDVRGVGGYVMIPPSVVCDSAYGIDADDPLACPANGLFAPTTPASTPRSSNGSGRIPEGKRNQHLASLAGSMRRRGMSQAAIAAALEQVNTERCDPPLDTAEVLGIATSIGRYEPVDDTDGFDQDREPSSDGPTDPVKAIRTATFDEWISDEVPPALCDRLIYQGTTTTILGLAKQGKTYAALQIAGTVAAGWSFLGTLATKRSRVLYCSWELPLALIRKRMKGMAEAELLPDPDDLVREGWLHFYSHRTAAAVDRLDLATGDGWAGLRALVKQTGARVVVIDTLSKAAQVPHKDDLAWAAVLANFTAYARETGVSLVVVDHAHRARIGDTAATVAMGSQVKGADFSCVVKLERKRTDGEPDRWRGEIESWYDDDGDPLWYARPVHDDGSVGVGCEPCDPAVPPKRGRPTTTPQMAVEDWLRGRLANGVAVECSVLVEEALDEFPAVDNAATLKRKMNRALESVGGRTEMAGQRRTLWTLD